MYANFLACTGLCMDHRGDNWGIGSSALPTWTHRYLYTPAVSPVYLLSTFLIDLDAVLAGYHYSARRVLISHFFIMNKIFAVKYNEKIPIIWQHVRSSVGAEGPCGYDPMQSSERRFLVPCHGYKKCSRAFWGPSENFFVVRSGFCSSWFDDQSLTVCCLGVCMLACHNMEGSHRHGE